MPWFNVDDGLTFHPKVLAVGNGPIGAWVRLGAYCAKHSTEGFVPAEIVRMVASKREIATLVESGWLYEEPDGYRMHDYLDYNRDAATVARDREKAAERKRRQRERQRDNRDSHGVTPPVTDGVTHGGSHGPQAKPSQLPSISTDTSTPLTPAEGGGNDRIDAVADAYAAHALRTARAAGITITSEQGYRSTARRTALEHPDITRYALEWPSAPVDVVAAWLHGDKHSMAHHQRVPRLADDPAAARPERSTP